MCGMLMKSMYGTRDAAQNWENEYSNFMISLGFQRGAAVPCIFHHAEANLRIVIHGDDFTLLGPKTSLDWFCKEIVKKFEVKLRGRMGPGKNDDKHVRLLNRGFEWTPEGIVIEADQRHAELITKDQCLKIGYKGLTTPGVKIKGGDETELPQEQSTI